MAWPSKRNRRVGRQLALGYEEGPIPYGGPEFYDNPPPFTPMNGPGGCPPGFVVDIQSESCVPIAGPPVEYDTPLGPPLTNCGPPLRYNTPGIVPGCPEPPGRLMYMGQTQTVPAAGTVDFEFDAPGIFCPQRLLITSDNIDDIYILKISSGVRNQIIAGVIPAILYSEENVCCPMSCLDCICAPGVKLRIQIGNSDVSPRDVNVALVGTYYDIPAGMTARQASDTVTKGYPGCPVPGRDKMVGFAFAATGPFEVEIETPGRFCPKQLFFHSPTGALGALVITNIRTATEEQIIGIGNSTGIPSRLWSVENQCCVMSCFDCLCMPGVPMIIQGQVLNEIPIGFVGALIGNYEDVC